MAHCDLERTARRARRAYELGRAVRGLRWAAPLGLGLAFAAGHVGSARAILLALTAFTFIVAGRWYGRSIGRGVQTGAVAGLVPLLLPIVVAALGHHCSGCAPTAPMPLCLVACTVSGAVAALWSGTRPGYSVLSAEFAAALATAGLVGAVGCVAAGGFGLLGLAIGMLLGGVPTVVVRTARASH